MGTPNYPKNIATEWNKLQRDVKNAFTSANARKRMERIGTRVIEITGSLIMNAGAMLAAKYANGVNALWVGQAQYEGTTVGQVAVRRYDGSTAMQVFGGEGVPGYFSIQDREGNIIMSDDGATAKGLARPWLPYHFVDYTEIATPVHTTTSTGFAKHHAIFGQSQHPKITMMGYVAASGSDTAEVRIVDSGSGEIIATSGAVAGWVTLTANHPNYLFGQDFWYDIEVRRVAGTAPVGFTPVRVYGRQT